jgi:hypothetical protein
MQPVSNDEPTNAGSLTSAAKPGETRLPGA